MAKVNFLNQFEFFMSDKHISQLHGNEIRKSENEGTLFREKWREKFRKRTEQDWNKICWK